MIEEFVLLVNEVRLLLYRQRRYLFEFVMSFGVFLGVFAALVIGMELLPSEGLIPGKASLAMGFVVWSFGVAAFASVSSEVSDEVKARCLEQICTVASPLDRVLVRRALVHIFSALASAFVMLHLCFWIAGEPVEINFLPLFALLLLGAPSLVGLGFVLGGLNVLLKQVETVSAIMIMGVVVLVSLPAYPLGPLSGLPFSYAAARIMGGREELSVGLQDVAIIGLNSAVYFALGLFVFRRCYRVAIDRGSIGHA